MKDWKVYLGRKSVKGDFRTYIIDLRYPDGARQRLELGTTDRAVAASKLESWLHDIFPAIQRAWNDVQRAPESDTLNPRLRDIFDYYTETYLPLKNASPSTIQHHAQVLRDFELYCRDRRVGRAHQLSRAIVDGHARDLIARGRKPKTVHNALGTIRACLNVAVDAGLLEHSPIKKWVMPQVDDPDIQPLTPFELKTVVDIVAKHEPTIANVIQWMAYTGMRTSDAREIRWSQVDLTRGLRTRTQKKTGKRRTIAIAPKAMEALMAEKRRGRPGPNGEIFTDPDGQPFTRNYIGRAWKRALKKGKFHRAPRLHDLRHTFAYILINYTGCSLRSAQEALEHDNIKTTMKYCVAGPLEGHLSAFDRVVSDSTEQKPEQGHQRGTNENAVA